MIFEIEKQTERWNNDLMFVLVRTKTNIQNTKEKEILSVFIKDATHFYDDESN